MPTDTIYGLVGRAEDPSVVSRIYEIKKRAPEKPCIILISAASDVEKFSVTISDKQQQKLEEYWAALHKPVQHLRPGPTSIILDCHDDKLAYLHRDTHTLAFRVPAIAELRTLLQATGPLIAPSANPESSPPAKSTAEAKEYFGNAVDMYVDGGEVIGKPSKIIRLKEDGYTELLR